MYTEQQSAQRKHVSNGVHVAKAYYRTPAQLYIKGKRTEHAQRKQIQPQLLVMRLPALP